MAIVVVTLSLLLPSSILSDYVSPKRFTWTATGDNGMSGRASEYVIKYSSSPLTDENFWLGIDYHHTLIPSDPYTPESLDITLPIGHWYIAIKVGDEMQERHIERIDTLGGIIDTVFSTYNGRNWSEISNVVEKTYGISPPIIEGWE